MDNARCSGITRIYQDNVMIMAYNGWSIMGIHVINSVESNNKSNLCRNVG